MVIRGNIRPCSRNDMPTPQCFGVIILNPSDSGNAALSLGGCAPTPRCSKVCIISPKSAEGHGAQDIKLLTVGEHLL